MDGKMSSDHTELECLLPTTSQDKMNGVGTGDAEQQPGGMKRVLSNRFQVIKSEEDPHLSGPENEDHLKKGTSEPPPMQQKVGTNVRKLSSTGRFMVSSEGSFSENRRPSTENSHEDESPTSTGPDTPAAKQKGVHFSVGEREVEDDKGRQQSLEHNTFNMKSWRNMKTIEHPPIIDFYRNSLDVEGISTRPSMSALIHGGETIQEEQMNDLKKDHDLMLDMAGSGEIKKKSSSPESGRQSPSGSNPAQRTKFGWIQGVFVRCVLNIFGVILYLRISWVTGQAGIGLGSVVVLLASTVTTITALSTCAICTNGDVKGGGVYFLISRSLGPEFGGSIGLIFSVANSVAAAMYIVGFAETARDVMKGYGWAIIDNGPNDVRIIGFAICIILAAIVFVGTSFESKMQMGLLVILLSSIANYMIGCVFSPSAEGRRRGATGISLDTMMSNLMPDFRDGEGFFSVFAVYFPAATGIMAGANISGDLTDPQRAIPLGTLIAIFATTIVYLLTVFITGCTFVRDADGTGFPVFNSTGFVPPECAMNSTCEYGLMNNFQIIEDLSLWGPLILAGISAASLSSALASLVSAPKVFQAVCKDKLFPRIDYFAKGYGKAEEPRRGYILASIVAFTMVGIGDLNAIAPIISNFFLASYTLINYACFDQSFSDSPGFRPSFKYYSMWISLLGSVLCIFVMFIISWSTALITFLCFGALFLYILHRKPDVNWGSSTQAHSYKSALAGMVKLANTEEHVKNYRPQFLILSGNPATRPSLLDFAYNITKGHSLMICGYVVPLSGLGKLRPNIVLMGYKSNCFVGIPTEERLRDLNDYFGIIVDAFDYNLAVCVLRNPNGLDFGEAMRSLNLHTEEMRLNDEPNKPKLDSKPIPHLNEKNKGYYYSQAKDAEEELKNEERQEDNSSTSLAENFDVVGTEEEDEDMENEEKDVEAANEVQKEQNRHTFSLRRRNSRRPTMEQKALLSSIQRFQRKIKKARIDVWWLYDDGGLTLLIPHLMTIPKSYLEGATLRVFTISTSSRTMEQETRGMAALLSKFRIDFADVNVVPDIGRRPEKSTMDEWEKLISPYVCEDGECPPGMTTM
ncbi:hypothetical protein WR25_12391 [Diploscapter pachys]|uniref:Amino acid permease/ SLC12A domain-containing protein n=1 Tax=Diploscapter pachys TaxID=2018661 RepID=A0A2A2JN34_9BILA|nr:hypothetical protein WR25_12391 [Diploscapter pachys]